MLPKICQILPSSATRDAPMNNTTKVVDVATPVIESTPVCYNITPSLKYAED
jgi:hypothetical protein